jgi:hypothetical protein
MYFIYLLMFVALDCAAFFFAKDIFEQGTDPWIGMLVFFIIFSVGFIMLSVVAIGQQLNLHTDLKKYVQEIETQKRKIKLSESKYDELKSYFEKYMGNDYPQFEKDLLTAISQKPEQLIAIFQAYPQLQASFTMSKLMDQVEKMVSEIYERRRNVENTKEHIRILMNSPWLLVKPKINTNEL